MLSILSDRARAEASADPEPEIPVPDDAVGTGTPRETPAETPAETPEETPEDGEFEIVLGGRQIAGVSFVGVVVLAIFCAISYLAGKSIALKKIAAAPPVVVAPPVSAEPPPIDATILAPSAPLKAPDSFSPPVFADPAIGSVYIQMAAVDKGIAAVFVAGLRSHGFQSFVAPGPTDKQYRVLIGPLPNAAAFTIAKDKLDQLGLTTFGRRYEK